MSDVIFNIHGGNNQIAPNATEAIQNIYTNTESPAKQYDQAEVLSPLQEVLDNNDELPAELQRLAIYINKEKLADYINQIAACQSVSELAQVVVSMALQEPRLNSVEIAKERFIEQILPFAMNIKKGTSISNVRQRINDAWANRSRTNQR